MLVGEKSVNQRLKQRHIKKKGKRKEQNEDFQLLSETETGIQDLIQSGIILRVLAQRGYVAWLYWDREANWTS